MMYSMQLIEGERMLLYLDQSRLHIGWAYLSSSLKCYKVMQYSFLKIRFLASFCMLYEMKCLFALHSWRSIEYYIVRMCVCLGFMWSPDTVSNCQSWLGVTVLLSPVSSLQDKLGFVYEYYCKLTNHLE